MVLSVGLGRMISSPQHLRLQSIEVGSEACQVHLAREKGLVRVRWNVQEEEEQEV
jgi:hypothetical protein